MALPGPDDSSFGEALFDLGWRQGALFTAPVAYSWNSPTETGEPEQSIRPVKPSERLVLITQDCDVVAPVSREPFVEALICQTANSAEYLARIDRNSARQFVIDPERHLVAAARYRVQIAKELLANTRPEPWPSGPERFGRFVRWLARRYDRPALPDALVNYLQQPVSHALGQLHERSPAIGRAFSAAVTEIRVNLPESVDPPFSVELVFLVASRSLTGDDLQAIGAAMSAINDGVDRQFMQLVAQPRILSHEEMSVAEYFATRPLFLDNLTFRGEEVDGARPLPSP